MRRRGIIYKLLISFTTITAVVLSLLGIFLSSWLHREYMKERQISLEKQMNLIETATLNFLNQNSNSVYEELRSVMKAVKSNIGMDSIIVDNLGYAYVVSSDNLNKLKYTKLNIPQDELEKFKNGEAEGLLVVTEKNLKQKIHIKPVFNNGFFSGTIVLLGNDYYWEGLTDVYQSIWISLAIALILSCAVAYYFTRKILIKPLSEINNAAKRLAKGDVEKRVYINSKDEIGELAESFNIMAESLEKVDKKRREFISNVSHELRSPITSIKGFITGILDGVIPKDRENYYLNIVSDEVCRLSRLVNDLLDISAMEAGKFNLNKIQLDINDIITLCTLNLEGKIKDKKMNVEVVFHDNHEYCIADRDRIIQVVTNVLENAIKYGINNGEIKIDTYSRGEKVYVSIFNNGPTIAKEDINNIWDRFYKIDKSRTNKVSTGLGLPIVRLILSQHNQDIWIDNIDGKGVKFTFTLEKAN
ncbi:HAMP domain-containing sensor histidine kinase [Clostridium carnis]